MDNHSSPRRSLHGAVCSYPPGYFLHGSKAGDFSIQFEVQRVHNQPPVTEAREMQVFNEGFRPNHHGRDVSKDI